MTSKIEIMSTRCAKCKRLEVGVRRAIHELDIPVDIIIVTDFETIRSRGIMSLPALCINEKMVLSGVVPDLQELKDIILRSTNGETTSPRSSSSD
jgi:small redox-active disulfide protein 2